MPNTLKTKGYAALRAHSSLEPFSFERREPRDHDVLIEILYCGICHSDIHQARDEWGGSVFPMVPGHEIVGKITRVGKAVTRFKSGDLAGVGCFVDSCRTCSSCKQGLEQFCTEGMVGTYNSVERDKKTPTFGGYSSQIVVDENYVLRVSDKLPIQNVAPLLCAGITTYSPLRHWKVGKGSRVAVMGLGGLGHMAVKLAAAMGAEVTMLSTSKAKEADARRLGAHAFCLTSQDGALARLEGHFDLIINSVSASIDLNPYLATLATNGTMVMLGVPPKAVELQPFSLIFGRHSLAGSLIGGIAETQEMLDFCAAKNITSDVEVIPVQKINEAYERTIKGDVRYRFVIDMKTL
ncbi:MAG: NAD(P)-dependent alcohol dehydrogenase [Oligoflexia bacterium]|nr:NAD(P)-dependent alcohol dehydrogenase [Oligoflexia bacterium]